MARILVIDDDGRVRETLRVLLTQAGHQPVFSIDGKRGMEAFAEARPDLVITDILMPEKDGLETIHDLRDLQPDIPILAISAAGHAGRMSFLGAAGLLGADRMLPKPFEFEDLLAAVTALLAKPQANA